MLTELKISLFGEVNKPQYPILQGTLIVMDYYLIQTGRLNSREAITERYNRAASYMHKSFKHSNSHTHIGNEVVLDRVSY